jgi:excisionase family DNA binding protein
MAEGDSLWTVDRLSAFLHVPRSTAYYLVAHDRIPGVVRLGPRLIRIDPEAIRAWLDAERLEPTGAVAR